MIEQIQKELNRLKVSTEFSPNSGLSVERTDEAGRVRVFDDHADGDYAPHQLLGILRSLEPGDTSLKSEDSNNIWQLIAPAEF